MSVTTTMEPPAQTHTRPEVTAEHAAFLHENGYLALPDALSPGEVQALNDETVRICRGEMGDVAGLLPVGRDGSDDSESAMYTLPLGLLRFKGRFGNFWHLVMAASMITILPVIIIFFFSQRQFVQGAQFSGLAGR